MLSRATQWQYHPMLLDVAPMERVAGWTLEGEDPTLYSPRSAVERWEERVA